MEERRRRRWRQGTGTGKGGRGGESGLIRDHQEQARGPGRPVKKSELEWVAEVEGESGHLVEEPGGARVEEVEKTAGVGGKEDQAPP